MAVFTAVNTDGETRWNQWKTWAAADPGGGEGSQYPGAADSFVVPNTKTVLVNGQYPAAGSIGGGDCSTSAGGTLTFDHTTNTRLTLGAVNFTNSGTTNMGTATNPIGAAYTCGFLITPATDGAKDFITGTGGVWNVYGHVDYYGNLFATYLGADWNGAAATIVVRGDWSTIPDNTELWIHKNRVYGSTGHTNDLARCFVNTTGGATPPTYSAVTGETTITIDGIDAPGVATSTWLDGGRVVCMSRNVTIGLASASRALGNYNANRPDFALNTASTVLTPQEFHNCEFLGCRQYYFYNANMDRVVGRNGRSIQLNGATVTDQISATNEYYGLDAKELYVDGCVIVGSITSAISSLHGGFLKDVEIFANAAVNNNGIYYYFGSMQDSYMYSNGAGPYGAICRYYNCYFNYNKLGDNLEAATDFTINATELNLNHCKMPSTLVVGNTNSYYPGRIICHDYDQTIGDHRIYDGFGSILLVDPDGAGDRPSAARTGGHTQVLEVVPLSKTSNQNVLDCYGSRLVPVRVWVTTGVVTTLSLYIQSEYEMTTAGIKLYARYLDASSHMVETNSTETIAARTGDTDWTQYLSVTFTPGATGWAELWAECYQYSAAADYFYIDPLLDGMTSGSTVRWYNGQPVIQEPSGGGTYLVGFHYGY